MRSKPASILAASLLKLTELTELNIRENAVSNDGMKKILDSLRQQF